MSIAAARCALSRSACLKVATYYVNGINGRLPRWLEWLAETKLDVVCLQKLKTDDTNDLRNAARRTRGKKSSAATRRAGASR